MPKPSNPGGYDSAAIAKRLIVEAVVPKIVAKAETIIKALEDPLNLVMDDFFRELADEMGQPTFDSSIFPHWDELAPGYVLAKGTAAFWLYSLAPGTQNKLNVARGRWGLSRTARRMTKKVQDPLIQRFQQTSGLQAFGKVKIAIDATKSFKGVEKLIGVRDIQDKRTPVRGKSTGPRGKARQSAISSDFTQRFAGNLSYDAYKVVIKVSLWSALSKSGYALRDQFIEHKLHSNGVFNQDTFYKLVGQGNDKRQLVRPFMAYYSRVMIPGVIHDIIQAGFSANTKGRNVVTPKTKVRVQRRKG